MFSIYFAIPPPKYEPNEDFLSFFNRFDVYCTTIEPNPALKKHLLINSFDEDLSWDVRGRDLSLFDLEYDELVRRGTEARRTICSTESNKYRVLNGTRFDADRAISSLAYTVRKRICAEEAAVTPAPEEQAAESAPAEEAAETPAPEEQAAKSTPAEQAAETPAPEEQAAEPAPAEQAAETPAPEEQAAESAPASKQLIWGVSLSRYDHEVSQSSDFCAVESSATPGDGCSPSWTVGLGCVVLINNGAPND